MKKTALASWLSGLPDNQKHSRALSPCPLTAPPSPPSPSLRYSPRGQGIKRKLCLDPQDLQGNGLQRRKVRVTRRALQAVSANIVEHRPTDTSPPSTPQKQTRIIPPSSSSISSARNSAANSSHFTTSTTSTEQWKQNMNVESIRASLETNGMWFHGHGVPDKYPAFWEKIQGIVGGERSSTYATASFRRFQEFMGKNSLANENTLFGKIKDFLIGDSRTVKVSHGKNALDIIETVVRTFEEDEVQCWRDQKFTKNFLPGSLSDKAKDEIGLTDPKPDFAYGFSVQTRFLPGTAPSIDVRRVLEVCPGMWHTYFVIEGKSARQPIDVARNQAIRDGSTVVNARFVLNSMAHDLDHQYPLGPDEESICFSCTWDPNFAELWVHWYEVMTEDGLGIWHMHRVGLYMMIGDRKDEVRQFQHDTHNILDWGIFVNRKSAERVMEKIRLKELAQAGTEIRNNSPKKTRSSPRKRDMSPRKRAGL